MRAVKRIELAERDRVQLERIVRAAKSEARMIERVIKWRSRYARDGIDGLRDAPRSGPPLRYGPQVRALLIAKACTRPPATAEGARQERWTYEQLGAAVGMSGSQAHEILSRAAIKPHLTDYWIMSDFSRPEFEKRLLAGVRLVRRSALKLPRDLDRREDAEIPVVDGQQIVAITDNLSTRGTQEVQDWLQAHPRWRFQFTPTHASWLNRSRSSSRSSCADCSSTASSPGSTTSPNRCSATSRPITRPPSPSSGPTPGRFLKHDQTN